MGIGFPVTKVKDQGQSPLLYKSRSPSIKIGFVLNSAKWCHKVDFCFQYGKIVNRYSPDFYKKQPFMVLFRLNYSVARTCLRYASGVNLSTGTFIDLTGNLRMIPKLENSMASYEMFPNIGLLGCIKKDIRNDSRNLLLSYNLQMPVLSYLMRPNYVTMMNYVDPKANYLKTILSNGSIVTANKLFRINSILDLAFCLENNNRIKLSYLWDYYLCNTANISAMNQYGFTFSTMSNF